MAPFSIILVGEFCVTIYTMSGIKKFLMKIRRNFDLKQCFT